MVWRTEVSKRVSVAELWWGSGGSCRQIQNIPILKSTQWKQDWEKFTSDDEGHLPMSPSGYAPKHRQHLVIFTSLITGSELHRTPSSVRTELHWTTATAYIAVLFTEQTGHRCCYISVLLCSYLHTTYKFCLYFKNSFQWSHSFTVWSLFCAVNHARTVSIYFCPLLFWLTLRRGVLSTCSTYSRSQWAT